MRRVHHDSAHDAGEPQPHDAEVVAGLPAPARLPAVHPFPALGVGVLAPLGRVGLQEVFLAREELVVRVQDGAAQGLDGEVGEVGEVRHLESSSPAGGSAKPLEP